MYLIALYSHVIKWPVSIKYSSILPFLPHRNSVWLCYNTIRLFHIWIEKERAATRKNMKIHSNQVKAHTHKHHSVDHDRGQAMNFCGSIQQKKTKNTVLFVFNPKKKTT